MPSVVNAATRTKCNAYQTCLSKEAANQTNKEDETAAKIDAFLRGRSKRVPLARAGAGDRTRQPRDCRPRVATTAMAAAAHARVSCRSPLREGRVSDPRRPLASRRGDIAAGCRRGFAVPPGPTVVARKRSLPSHTPQEKYALAKSAKHTDQKDAFHAKNSCGSKKQEVYGDGDRSNVSNKQAGRTCAVEGRTSIAQPGRWGLVVQPR